MQGASRASLATASGNLDALARPDAGVDLGTVADGLFAVAHLLDREISLRRALSDPSSSGESRGTLIARLLGSQVDSSTLDLLQGLVRSSWSRPVDLVDAVESLAVQAIFTTAEQAGGLDDVEDELFRFGRILDREPQLLMALTDQALPAARRDQLVAALVEGRVRPATLRLVRELVDHPRGRTLGRGLEEYARLAADRRQRLVAQVTVAVPLTEDQTGRLASALAAQLGRAVHLNVELDPTVVGGMSVQVGDVVYDGTTLRRLADARRRLAG